MYNEIPETYKEDLIYPYLVIDENMAKITARIKDSEDINRKNIINDIKNANLKKANLLNLWDENIEITFGKATDRSGELSFDSIKKER